MGRLNKIMLIGNAGNDAELRYTPNGDGVASFSLAVGNRYTNREGQQIDETEWFRVTSWGRSAEFVSNYIKKGMQVYVEGRLSHSVYQDNAGETKISLEVNARDVQIVQDPQQQQTNPNQEQQSNPPQQQSNPPQQQSNPSQQQQPNPVQQPSTEPSTEDDPDKLP
ncbi:MAG: single-stranded DNA-binding protein, partial [Chloroflexi bacterium]|nr:single-stranded DNA-binding protein [Chloroflexota bacterium]